MIWVFVIFISILVHEFGHALTACYFGQKPRIELVAFGGLTYPGKQEIENAPDLIAWADDVLSRARAKGPGGVEIESP